MANVSNLYITHKRIKRIVLSGGGAKGVVYPGGYRALVETGVHKNVKEITGSSAGAIIAALIAVGMPIDKFREKLLNTNFKELLGATVGSLAKTLQPGAHNEAGVTFFTKDGIGILELVRKNITETIIHFLSQNAQEVAQLIEEDEELLDLVNKMNSQNVKITFADLALLHQYWPNTFINLTIPAVSYPDGQLQIFNSETTPQVEIALACRASASLPVVLAPVEIDLGNGQKPQKFVDAGVFDNLPADYFDRNTKGEFEPNKKPEQTLIFAFGEGLNNQKNCVYQALYGSRRDEALGDKSKRPVIYKASFIDNLMRNKFVSLIGGLNPGYKSTEQKEMGYQRLRSQYPLRTVELRVGKIKTTDFNLAKKYARIMDTLGYLDTINHITNHELHDPNVFNAEQFYVELVSHFEPIYEAILRGANKKLTRNTLFNEIQALKKELAGKSEAIVSRQIYQLIKDKVEQEIDSHAAFALSRAVEFRSNLLTAENLFKETYEKAFECSASLSASNFSGKTLFRASALHSSLKNKDMFQLFADKSIHDRTSRSEKVFSTLNQLDIFRTAHGIG